MHDVYRLNLRTGKGDLLLEIEHNVASWSADLEGNIPLGIRKTDDGGTEILCVKGKYVKYVYTYNCEENFSSIRFHKDGKRVYISTNKGDDVDRNGLVLFNPASQESELVDVDPQQSVDLGGEIFKRSNS